MGDLFEDGGAGLVEKLNNIYTAVSTRAVGSQLVIMTAISVSLAQTLADGRS